jgi:predicted flap endonuclease-1-like 5' DNA nuclease
MSLLYNVVFASRCRSNHHRLAVDALRHLRAPDAERWAEMLLGHHREYLTGAMAPDEVFKDFKNHVLHVREHDWGGAVEACEEWYRRTVRALKARDWKQAAWSAGVLSHYYVDPLQPFHTHQSEEEGVIHRAVEWSFSKSYKIFQKRIEAEGGYPVMVAPQGDKWLAEMVRAGARAANPHYELLIEHYDFEAGLAKPAAGLDEAIRTVVAELVAHAAVGFAVILDRAFAEAAVAPPRTLGALQAFFLSLEIPIQALLQAIDDGAVRRQVCAQYEEFRRTGKVRATLSEDDKVVRALHAAEVLNTPLSSLDAKWPREIGALAGKPLAPRLAAKPKAVKPAPAAVLAETPAPKPGKALKIPRELPVGAPRAKPEKSLPRFLLSGDAPVLQAPSIGPKTAKRLEAAGIRTVADLLALKPEEGEAKLDARHASAQTIRDWQALALLACTAPGLKSHEAQALVACGVRDSEALARADAVALCEAIAQWGLSEDGQRAWGSAPAPNEDDIATWIARVKRASAAA